MVTTDHWPSSSTRTRGDEGEQAWLEARLQASLSAGGETGIDLEAIVAVGLSGQVPMKTCKDGGEVSFVKGG